MRKVFWVVLVAACGDGGGGTTTDAPMAMSCQVDADCGMQFCNANVCGARPMWNAPTKLGGGVPLDGSQQHGASLRGDNLEIVFASSRSSSCLDLWHATRASASADFDAPTVLANINVTTSTACEGSSALRADGLELFFVRGGAAVAPIFTTTRATTTDDFAAPTQVALAANMGVGGIALSSDGLSLMYMAGTTPGQPAAVYLATRASTSDAFTTSQQVTDLGMQASGIALSPDGRYVITASVVPGLFQVRTRGGATGVFGAPQDITEIPSSVLISPFVSRDGKTLLYATRNAANDVEIWSATRK